MRGQGQVKLDLPLAMVQTAELLRWEGSIFSTQSKSFSRLELPGTSDLTTTFARLYFTIEPLLSYEGLRQFLVHLLDFSF